MPAEQPTLARRTLGIAFRRHRKAQGNTLQEAADAIGYSANTVTRIENGEQPTRLNQAKDLCDFYGVAASEKSRLCALAVSSKERGWWEPYFDKGRNTVVNPKSPLFLETEQEAVRIWVLETEVIPGLLQTPGYLRALQAAGLPMTEESAEGAHGLRAHRQKSMFGRADLPELKFIIGSSALRYLDRLPGDLKSAQIARLHEIAALSNVEIRVLTELHAATANSFTVLTPSDELPPFVYLDAVDGCRYVEDVDVVSLYERVFTAAYEKTETIEEYLK